MDKWPFLGIAISLLLTSVAIAKQNNDLGGVNEKGDYVRRYVDENGIEKIEFYNEGEEDGSSRSSGPLFVDNQRPFEAYCGRAKSIRELLDEFNKRVKLLNKKRNPHRKHRIGGGASEITYSGVFPSVVAVDLMKPDGSIGWRMTGVVLSPYHILTLARKIKFETQLEKGERIFIRHGPNEFSKSPKWFIQRICNFPNAEVMPYNKETKGFVILRARQKLNYSENFHSACLPTRPMGENQLTVFVGAGKVSNAIAHVPDSLHASYMRKAQCLVEPEENLFCVTGAKGKMKACAGDEGAPLLGFERGAITVYGIAAQPLVRKDVGCRADPQFHSNYFIDTFANLKEIEELISIC